MSRFVRGYARMRVGRVAVVAGAIGMVATGLTAGVGTDTASAATCLDGATRFTKDRGRYYVPKDGTWTTTSRCTDINLRIILPSDGMEVSVCFVYGSRALYICKPYTTVGSSWKVVASGVEEGTNFKLEFRNYTSPAWGHAAY